MIRERHDGRTDAPSVSWLRALLIAVSFLTVIGQTNQVGAEVASPNTAVAAQLNAAGDKAWEAKDYVAAAKSYRQAAAAGNVDAQYSLGVHYQMGRGVPRDPKVALQLLTAAANAGQAKAMARVAMMYWEPDGIPQNLPLARKWAEAAAQRGNVKGAALFGYLLDHGEGGPMDKCAALKWYLKAEAGGNTLGDVYVGTIYAAGQCGPANWPLARRYFERSAKEDNRLAQLSLQTLDRLESENRTRAYGAAIMAGVRTFVETVASSPGDDGSTDAETIRFNNWVANNRSQGLNDNGTPK